MKLEGILYFGTKESYGLTYEPAKSKLFSLEFKGDKVEFLSCNDGISVDDLEEVLENVLKFIKKDY